VDVIDLDIYRATKVRVPYDEPLGKYLHDLDKANRAVEETLGIFKDRRKLRSYQKPWWQL
jgi:hypothetical protein